MNMINVLKIKNKNRPNRVAKWEELFREPYIPEVKVPFTFPIDDVNVTHSWNTWTSMKLSFFYQQYKSLTTALENVWFFD